MVTDDHDLAAHAKAALEQVCSGANLGSARQYYSEHFVDHVNDRKFLGWGGINQSVHSYRSLLSNLKIIVHDQIFQGDRVASRFVVTGLCYGREVRANGITVSRFENQRIIEDWSVTDTLGLLKQIGLWRCLRLLLRRKS